ncbi:hypothetical protein [Paenibacillus chitinolyticus]
MIELQVDTEFEIDNAKIADSAAVSEDQIRNVILLHPMAFADGHLAIRSLISFHTQLPSGRMNALFHVEIGSDGLRTFNLSDHLPRHTAANTPGSEYISVPMCGDVLYVGGTDNAFLLSRGITPEIRKVHIEQRVGDAPGFRLRPSPYAHFVSTDGSVAVPLQDAAHAKYLAVLTLDRDALTARWSAFVNEGAGSTVTDRKFSPPMLLASDLPQLVSADFTQVVEALGYNPLFNEALIRHGRVYVYTKGPSDSLKYGYPYSAIAEIGADGRVKSLPFVLDFASIGDGKKRGLDGRFTASGRYCVLNPIYKAADSWKGRQKLFDMEQGELVDIHLPRGYAKYNVMDHAGGYFWAELREPGKSHRFVRFRLQNAG